MVGMKKMVSCPKCQTPALFSPENPYRPFCSERCKNMDLADWADGKYGIAITIPQEDDHLLSEDELEVLEMDPSEKQ